MGCASCHAEESGLLGKTQKRTFREEPELVAAEALIPAGFEALGPVVLFNSY